MGNFKNACLKTLLVTTCLLLASNSFAQRSRGGFDSDFDFDFDRDPARHSRNVSVENLFIGQTFFPGERLFLGRELGLRNFQGYEIEGVELQIEGMRRGGHATLTINRRPVSHTQQFRGRRVGAQTLFFPLQRSFVIGQDVQKLQVEFEGTAYVSEATVILKKKRRNGNGPGKDILEREVHREIFGVQNIPMTRLIQVGPRKANRPVKKIVLVFRSHERFAQMRLCEKGFDGSFRGRDSRRGRNCQSVEHTQGMGRQRVVLQAGGMSLNELSMFMRGDMTLKKVKVHFYPKR